MEVASEVGSETEWKLIPYREMPLVQYELKVQPLHIEQVVFPLPTQFNTHPDLTSPATLQHLKDVVMGVGQTFMGVHERFKESSAWINELKKNGAKLYSNSTSGGCHFPTV